MLRWESTGVGDGVSGRLVVTVYLIPPENHY